MLRCKQIIYTYNGSASIACSWAPICACLAAHSSAPPEGERVIKMQTNNCKITIALAHMQIAKQNFKGNIALRLVRLRFVIRCFMLLHSHLLPLLHSRFAWLPPIVQNNNQSSMGGDIPYPFVAQSMGVPSPRWAGTPRLTPLAGYTLGGAVPCRCL